MSPRMLLKTERVWIHTLPKTTISSISSAHAQPKQLQMRVGLYEAPLEAILRFWSLGRNHHIMRISPHPTTSSTGT